MIIGMEALGEDAIDAMDGVEISVGADLHRLVMIDEWRASAWNIIFIGDGKEDWE